MLALAATPAQSQPTAAAAWIARLQSSDVMQRLAASYDYRDLIKDPATSVPELITALGNPSAAVREHAAAALGEMTAGTGSAVEPLLASLRDSSPSVQSQAALSLAKIGGPAASAIVRQLLEKGYKEPTSEGIIWEDYAVASLRIMQERSASAIAAALPELIQSDLESQKRAAGPPVLMPAGRPAYSGDQLKLKILSGLASGAGARIVADQLLQRSTEAEPDLRGALVEAASRILISWGSESYVDPDKERTARLAKFAVAKCCGSDIFGLGNLGDITVAAVEMLAKTGDTKRAADLIRQASVGGRAAEQWAPLVEQLLRQDNDELRGAAVDWLSRNSSTGIPLSEHLLLQLANGPDPKAAGASIIYLGRLGNESPELVDALVKLIARPDIDRALRRSLLRELADLGEHARSAEPALLKLAFAEASQSPESCDTVDALGHLGELTPNTDDTLITMIRGGRCTMSAANILHGQGWSAEKVVGAAALSGDLQTRVQAIWGGEASPDEMATERLPDVEPPAPVTQDRLFARLDPTKILALRQAPKIHIHGSTFKTYSFDEVSALDGPINQLETLDPTTIDQASPGFALLVDLKIFKSVEEAASSAADERLVLANPQGPNGAAAGLSVRLTRLLPKWPWSWPPPKYSSWQVMDMTGLAPDATIGTVYNRLSRSLNLNGYMENRLYGIPGGVAVITHLEQTTADGRPMGAAERWSYDPASVGRLSLVSYLADCFMGIRSHYRLFAFFITTQPDISGGQTTLPLQEADEPKVDGARILPPEIAAVPWKGFHLHVVTYRFNKVNSTVQPVTDDISSIEQLRRSGIYFAMEERT